jgi:hypothetical protein
MRVITTNPVFQSGNDKSPSEMYYNFNLGQFNQVQQGFTQSQEQKGLTWDKVKGAWTKAQESGLIDKGKELLGGLFGKGRPKKGQPPISTRPNGSGKPKKKPAKGMSTTTIVLIGVSVLVVGFVVYKLSKNK